MKKTNVLFVAHSASLYGADRSLIDLLAALPPDIVPTVVLPERGPFIAELERLGIAYHVVPFRRWIGNRAKLLRRIVTGCFNLLAVHRLGRIISQRNIDLVYTNTLCTPVGAAAARKTGAPHLWHVREFIGSAEAGHFIRGDRASVRFINKTTIRVICNSRAVADHLAALGVRVPTLLAYNGFRFAPPAALHELPSDKIVTVGCVSKTKNQEELIAAAGILKREGRDFSIEIAGEGPRRYRLFVEERINRLGLAGMVDFAGYLSDVRALYRNATVLVLCGKEAFGRVLVEAMALGCPVIAPRCGGATEIVTEGETGFLYDPGDSSDLARKITHVLDHAGELDDLRRRAQESVRSRFPIDRYGETIVETIRTLSRSP